MNHTVKSQQDSFNLIVSKLRSGKPFSFVRFGDGDYMIMYPENKGKIIGWNNRFEVAEALQKELIECHNIHDGNFLIGTILNDTSNYFMKPFNGKIDQNRLNLSEHKELLAMACLQEILLTDVDTFMEFPREMRKTNTMLVGGYNHKNLSKIYGDIDVFIKTPQFNSYKTIDTWYPQILESAHKVGKIVLMTGFSSRVVAKRLFNDKPITAIDVGSLSDMFVLNTGIAKNIPVRSHIKNVRSLVDRNTREVLSKLK